MYIDFVIIWVDGNDPQWQADYSKYASKNSGGDSSNIRYRDYDLLKYWFRGVEKFAPWVRRIHFVTSGHYPEWLDLNHEKINFVRHEQFIPKEYLPTFNSHTIELNLHRIDGLSDNFVYFNDDFFILNDIKEDYFFNLKRETPKDCLIFNPIAPGGISHIVMNCVEIIHNNFSKKQILKNGLFNIFNFKYGKELIRSICLMPWPYLIGFKDTHLPTAYKKKTFEKVWNIEYDVLNRTCYSRFRQNTDVNQYIMRYWQLASGSFDAKNVLLDSLYLDVGRDDVDRICSGLMNKNKKIVIINDSDIDNFEYVKNRLAETFDNILPEKSTFEL